MLWKVCVVLSFFKLDDYVFFGNFTNFTFTTLQIEILDYL